MCAFIERRSQQPHVKSLVFLISGSIWIPLICRQASIAPISNGFMGNQNAHKLIELYVPALDNEIDTSSPNSLYVGNSIPNCHGPVPQLIFYIYTGIALWIDVTVYLFRS